MKIIHFGDIHIWRNPFVLYDPFYAKRYLGAVNLLMNRRKKFPRHLGQTVVDKILEEEADAVVFSGDMTTASLKSEFEAAAKMFQPIRDKWGDKFFVIPGNHDRYTSKSVKKDWYSQYFPYGKIDGVRVENLADNYVVLMFDASREFMFRSNGLFYPKLREQLTTAMEVNSDKNIILVGHYPADYPDHIKIVSNHEMINRVQLQDILKKYKPTVYLHGHKHVRWRLGCSVNCGAAGMLSTSPNKQAGYVTVNLNGSLIEQVEACSVSIEGQVSKQVYTEDF